MKILLVLLALLLLAGCGTLRSDREITTHKGRSGLGYDVEVRITRAKGRCLERRITLRAERKLHIKPVVQHVRVTDRQCNQRIDDWHFRDSEEGRSFNRTRLAEDIWSAYAQVVPIPDQQR